MPCVNILLAVAALVPLLVAVPARPRAGFAVVPSGHITSAAETGVPIILALVRVGRGTSTASSTSAVASSRGRNSS